MIRRLAISVCLVVLLGGSGLAQTSACPSGYCVYLSNVSQPPSNVVVRNDQGIHGVSAGYNIFGEIYNGSSAPIYYISINARFYDNNNNLLDMVTSGIEFDMISAGKFAPFSTGTGKDGVARYTIMLDYKVTRSPGAPPLRDLPIPYSQLSRHEWVEITGEVSNSSSSYTSYVEVALALYDNTGKVVGVMVTEPPLRHLPPGEKTTFEFDFDEMPFVAYSLVAQGVDMVPPP